MYFSCVDIKDKYRLNVSKLKVLMYEFLVFVFIDMHGNTSPPPAPLPL